MKKLSHNEIKQIELNMLLEFDKYCKTQGLTYYLCGGTLLGAIRHNGFIPWDDDIDVCMPRPDYTRFVNGANGFFQKSKMKVEDGSMPGEHAMYAFAKILDLNTQIRAAYSNRQSHLWIDIFPVDGLPEDINTVRNIYRKADLYRKMLRLTGATLGKGKTAFRKYGKYLLKPLACLYGEARCVKKINDLAKPYKFETCKYVGIVTNGLYGESERMLKQDFEISEVAEFEGHKFPIFSCWDSYLHNLYGDYMELPPLEKRKTHDMEVYLAG